MQKGLTIAAFAFLAGLSLPHLRHTAKSIPISSLGPSHPEQPVFGNTNDAFLQNVVERLKNGGALQKSERSDFEALIKAWLRRDAVECLNFLSAHDLLGIVDSTTLMELVGGPDSLVSLARSISNRGFADELFQQAFAQQLKDSPKDCLQMLSGFPPYLRMRLEREAIEAILRVAGAAGLQEMIDSKQLSARLTYASLLELSKSDPAGALRLALPAAKYASRGRGNLFDNFLGFFYQKHPQECMDFLTAMPPGPRRDLYLGWCLTRLEASGVEGSTALATQLNSPTLAQHLASDAAFEIVSKDPKKAVELIEAIPSFSARTQAYAAAANNLMFSRGAAAMFSWVDAIDNPVDRSAATKMVCNEFVERDPPYCAAYLVDRISDTSLLPAAAKALSYAAQDALKSNFSNNNRALQNLSPEQKETIRNQVAPLMKEDERAAILRILQ